MKKNIGKNLTLYPTPLVVVGTMVNPLMHWWDISELSATIVLW